MECQAICSRRLNPGLVAVFSVAVARPDEQWLPGRRLGSGRGSLPARQLDAAPLRPDKSGLGWGQKRAKICDRIRVGAGFGLIFRNRCRKPATTSKILFQRIALGVCAQLEPRRACHGWQVDGKLPKVPGQLALGFFTRVQGQPAWHRSYSPQLEIS